VKLYHFLPQALLRPMKIRYEERNQSLRFRGAESQLEGEALRLSAVCLDEVKSLVQWQEKKEDLRSRLAWMLGLEPIPERAELLVDIAGIVDRQHYSIERVSFQSLPGLHVTANFYVPKGVTGPVPCVLYLNGHWPSLAGAKTGFQDRYLWYPANGFALLVVDPLQFGEVPGIHHGTSRMNLWNWLSLGYSPAGVEVWNAMRALDWLETRSEVDASRVAATGISGGGVMTQFLAALDDRVGVAVASCSTYTIGSQVRHRLVSEQCDCTFYPNVAAVDFPVVDALIAPRPLLILGGRKDPIFPPSGFREAFQRSKQVFDLFQENDGGGERIRLVESNDGHADPDHFLRESRRWIAHWLNEADRIPEEAFDGPQPESEPPDTLKCLPRIPPDAVNYHVHDVFNVSGQGCVPATVSDWEERRGSLLTELKGTVFSWFPQQAVPFQAKRLRGSGGYLGELADFGEYELDSEPGARIRVQLLRPKVETPSDTVIWIRGVRDHVGFPDLDDFLPLVSSSIVAVVTPRFADRPLPGAVYARIERTAAIVGRTIASLQVWDVMRALSWVCSETESRNMISVYGRAETGIIGLYAAILDDRIQQVVLQDPPVSHRQGPALLTILRHSDIPEVAAMLAPRRLTFLSGVSPELERTRNVFRLLGAEAEFNVRPSLAAAIIGSRNAGDHREGQNGFDVSGDFSC